MNLKHLSNQPILSCILNFSEGRDVSIIDKIAETVSAVGGVHLAHVDIGHTVNRTVLSFAGIPESVIEAAYRVIEKSMELIDMSQHKGEHPRIGAVDVCPLVPLQGINMSEVVTLAHQLAKRVGGNLQIPVYCYGEAATAPHRKALAKCRSGEYECLIDKLKNPDWQPDYGPATFKPKHGATLVAARGILLAYNVGLATNDVAIAKAIAAEIRESAQNGLAGVKAIGWHIPEYKMVQVSTNITNYKQTPLHQVFETIKIKSQQHKVKVIGSELIGMVPLDVLLSAGQYFTNKENNKPLTEEALVNKAVSELGLNNIVPYDPKQRVWENFF